MKNWKVIKKVYGNDIYYYVYRRWLFFFWRYEYMKTEEQFKNRVRIIENDGHKLSDFCYTVNF